MNEAWTLQVQMKSSLVFISLGKTTEEVTKNLDS